MEKQLKRVTPAFATEAEEARWWYQNRNDHGKQLFGAMQKGEAHVLTSDKLRARIATSREAKGGG